MAQATIYPSMQCDFQNQLRNLGAQTPCAIKQLDTAYPEANATTTLTS